MLNYLLYFGVVFSDGGIFCTAVDLLDERRSLLDHIVKEMLCVAAFAHKERSKANFLQKVLLRCIPFLVCKADRVTLLLLHQAVLLAPSGALVVIMG